MKVKLSLEFKIISIVFLVSLLIFGILSYTHFTNYKKDLTDSFIKRAEAVTQSFETGIESKEDLQDNNKLLLNIQKQIWLDPDIIEISLSVPEENILQTYVSNNPDKVNKPVTNLNYDSYRDDSIYSQIKRVRDTRVLTVVSPVHVSGKILGTYEMEATLETVDKKIEQELKITLQTFAVVFLLFILILFFFLRFIVIRPILEINRGLEYVADDNFTYKINIKSQDEIGTLAKSFNSMIEKLGASRKALKEYSKNLEKKVKERTKELRLKMEELEKFNKMAVGRELRMVELKKKIKKLEKKQNDKT